MGTSLKSPGLLSSKALIASAVTLAVIVALAKFTLVTILVHLETRGLYLRLQDSILTGILSAAVAIAIMWVGRERRRYLLKQVEVVAGLNHELRNALEVILANEYLVSTTKGEAILESVSRIERALNNILNPRIQDHRL